MIRTVLLLCVAQATLLGAQVRIQGTVRDRSGAPVAGAEAYVLGEGAHAIANDSGHFVLSVRGHRTISLRVRRIGFVANDKQVELPDAGSTSVDITLEPLPQSVATVRVVANRAGLYGTVRTLGGAPLPDVEIEVLGAGTNTTRSDASGEFDMPLKKSGVFYLMARKRGFAYVRSSLTFNADSGREADIVMTPALGDDASGFGRMEFILSETGTRIAMKASRASVVPREVLESRGAVPLSEALCGTQVTTNFPSTRCPVAPDAPGPGASRNIGLNVCILVNGDQRSFLPLDQFTADQVESVEFYPKGSDWSGLLKTRQCDTQRYDVFIVWLRREK